MTAMESLQQIIMLRVGADGPCTEGRICWGGWHHKPGPGRHLEATHRCPALVRQEIRVRIEEDIERLEGVITWANEGGGFGMAGYDTERHPAAQRALDAVWAFCEQRPPDHSLLLSGPPGLGKTRLLLGSHFELLACGINSHFVMSSELRRILRDAAAHHEEDRYEARQQLDRWRQGQVIHCDDVGDIEGDQRFRGDFAEGLKELLDTSRSRWAVATNLTGEGAKGHPDVGLKVLSRLLRGAVVVKMTGDDQRWHPPGGPDAR